MSLPAVFSLTSRSLRILLCVVLVALSLASGGKARVMEPNVAQHSWFQDSVSTHLRHDAHPHDHDALDRQLADHHQHLEPIHDVVTTVPAPDTGAAHNRQAWLPVPDDRARGQAVGGPDHPPSV